MAEEKRLQDLTGLVATIVTSGSVHEEFSQCREDLRAYNIENGFEKTEYRHFTAVFVERGRDNVLKHAFFKENTGYDFVIQIDADAVFPANTMHRLLEDAFIKRPDADMVGAYANLKAPPYLPTIDTGTGTWEPIYPGRGILPVIRTGGHCFLVKPSAVQKMGQPPWFRTRLADRPIDAMANLDNFARMKLDGKNPLTEHPEWHTLLAQARDDTSTEPSAVGEDSAFCDRLRAAGGNIYVDTDLMTGHLAKQRLTWRDFRDEMKDRQSRVRLACGIRDA